MAEPTTPAIKAAVTIGALAASLMGPAIAELLFIMSGAALGALFGLMRRKPEEMPKRWHPWAYMAQSMFMATVAGSLVARAVVAYAPERLGLTADAVWFPVGALLAYFWPEIASRAAQLIASFSPRKDTINGGTDA